MFQFPRRPHVTNCYRGIGHVLARESADAVLRIAQAAAPASEDEFEGMSFDPDGTPLPRDTGLPGPEAVERTVDEFLDKSDALIEQLGDGTAQAGAPLPVLISAMELSGVLLAASQNADDAYRTYGIDDSGGMSLAGPNAVLDEMQRAVTGAVPVVAVTLPDELTAKLDALQKAGGEELVKLGQDAVLLGALDGAVGGIATIGGAAVQAAFDRIRHGINVVRRAAAKILVWIVDHVRALVPEKFRDDFDDKLKEITNKIKNGMPSLVGDVLGRLLGRPPAEAA